MRTTALVLVLLTSCVFIEAETGIPERDCGEKAKTPDDGRCRCDSDCASEKIGAFCLAEYEYGWPGGVCTRSCKVDAECGAGLICEVGFCSQVCTSSADCGPGRMCRGGRDGRPTTCFEICDEDADCDNQACNVYSGMCLLYGERIQGAGLNAPCTRNDECRSDWCSGGACRTRCDMSAPRCPDGGVCLAGWCENACTPAGACALNQSCVETEAGKVCSDGSPTTSVSTPASGPP